MLTDVSPILASGIFKEVEMNMLSTMKSLGLAAVVAIVPSLSSALTLTIDDLGTAGVDQTVVGASTANFSGMAGGFSVAIASGNISSTGSTYTLNTSSIQTSGVGTLQIAAEQLGLTGFNGPVLDLAGSGSVTDIGVSVTVEHFINTGGGYQMVGDVLNFAGGQMGPVNMSDITYDSVAMPASFDLKSVFTIVTDSSDMSANVNSTLVASVPVPAAGLLLLTALGGMGIARRRKKA